MHNRVQRVLAGVSAGVLALAVSACGESTTAPGGEQELITRVTLTFTPEGGGTPIVTYIDDPDGAGPLPPTAQVGALSMPGGTSFTGTVKFENRLENPPEDITEEVEEEADEHRVFYIVSGTGLSLNTTDVDGSGRPLGVQFAGQAAPSAATGTLRVVLCHYGETTKPAQASSCTVDTDIDVTFNYTITN